MATPPLAPRQPGHYQRRPSSSTPKRHRRPLRPQARRLATPRTNLHGVAKPAIQGLVVPPVINSCPRPRRVEQVRMPTQLASVWIILGLDSDRRRLWWFLGILAAPLGREGIGRPF